MFVITCFNDLFSLVLVDAFLATHTIHGNTQTFKSTSSFKIFSASLHLHYMSYLLGERKKGAKCLLLKCLYIRMSMGKVNMYCISILILSMDIGEHSFCL